jgi:L-lactate dehydrogenase
VPKVIEHNRDCILLVVTNPVDILTYATLKISGLPENQVFGSGTVLDSARFRYLLSAHCHVAPHNVHAYIIGEHGDTEVPAWSITNIAGVPIDKFCAQCGADCMVTEKERIFQEVKNSAYRIIEGKGATYYAVALAVRRIVEAVLRNENAVLSVSSLMKGHFGLENVCLSLPSIVNEDGIVKVLELGLSQEEIQGFQHSARTLRGILTDIGL